MDDECKKISKPYNKQLKDKITREIYKEWSSTYDDYETNIAILLEMDRFIEVVKPSKKETILDAGCGTGRYIEKLKDSSKRVIGLDFSKEMINIAKEKYPDVEFHHADLTKGLKFKDNYFDKIISSLVFPHFKNIDFTLKEFYRILKSGGRLYITDFPWHGTIDWKNIKYKKKPIYRFDYQKTSYHRPIAEYLDKTSLIGYKLVGIELLRVTPKLKKYLTRPSYKKNKGKWGTAIFIFEK